MTTTTAERLDALLAEKGGRCLSNDWTCVDDKITMECEEGHRWEVRMASLLYTGSWCPECVTDGRRIGLERMRQLATEKGGTCLSTSYVNNTAPLRWRCADGHEFEKTAKAVSRGTWCPICRLAAGPNKRARRFIDAVQHAEGLGGAHIGNARLMQTRTYWRCRHGHTFAATGRAILTRSYFCPSCERPNKPSLASIRAECERRGGRCLSKSYVNITTPMEFECGHGHRWTAKWRNVGLLNSWCPTCAGRNGGADRLVAIADAHGGQALSRAFVTARTPYRWLCRQGHVFEATLATADRRWCTECQDTRSPIAGALAAAGYAEP